MPYEVTVLKNGYHHFKLKEEPFMLPKWKKFLKNNELVAQRFCEHSLHVRHSYEYGQTHKTFVNRPLGPVVRKLDSWRVLPGRFKISLSLDSTIQLSNNPPLEFECKVLHYFKRLLLQRQTFSDHSQKYIKIKFDLLSKLRQLFCQLLNSS